MVEKSGIETWPAHYMLCPCERNLYLIIPLKMGAGKLLWMPGEMLEGKVAMDKHPTKGEGGGGE